MAYFPRFALLKRYFIVEYLESAFENGGRNKKKMCFFKEFVMYRIEGRFKNLMYLQ